MTDNTESLIKEKNLTSNDIYWLEMEKDSYKEDKEKFDAIQKTINTLKQQNSYNCPLCDSKYKRQHELSASNWECGSVKEGDSIFASDLCNARRRVKELEKGLENVTSYAKEYVKKHAEVRDKLIEAIKDLKDFEHDECAEAYEIFLDKQVKK